jgi:cytochrome oxidase Cu insertion factor (SCO1/SenC/PrrC family)
MTISSVISTARKVIFLLTFVTAISACSQGPPVPFPAFDFSVEDLFSGEEIHLAELKGRPVLIYFFASW